MDADGGSNNPNGRGGTTPPDEQQIRLGRARIARGGNLLGDQSGLIGASTADDSGSDSGSSALGSTGGPSMASPLGGQPAGGGEAIDLAPRFRPWAEPMPSSAGPLRCHFLRSVGPDGRLIEAQKTAVPTHRCAAFGDPLPLSLRQQELVCLQRVHVSCPRYLRGTLLANESQSTQAQEQPRKPIPVLTILGVGLVVVALLAIVTVVLALPPFGGGAPSPSVAHGLVTQPSATPSQIATPKPSATPTASAPVGPSASPSVQPLPTVLPTPTVAPTPASSWPPGATASRMDRVVPCAGQASCYVYTVGPGDRLAYIADFFGVDLAKVRSMNPWLGSSNVIRTGDQLKIPPPTR